MTEEKTKDTIEGTLYIDIYMEDGTIEKDEINNIPDDIDSMTAMIFKFILRSGNNNLPIRYKIVIKKDGIRTNINLECKSLMPTKLIQSCLKFMEENNISIQQSIDPN